MARRHKKVVWTKQGYSTLDEAVDYVAQDSLTAAQQLLQSALDSAESLSMFGERGRIVPELQQPNVRELLIQRYRLIYEVFDAKVEILAFIPVRRDLWASKAHQKEMSGATKRSALLNTGLGSSTGTLS